MLQRGGFAIPFQWTHIDDVNLSALGKMINKFNNTSIRRTRVGQVIKSNFYFL